MLVHKCDICKKESNTYFVISLNFDSGATQEEIDEAMPLLGPNGTKEICKDCYVKTFSSLEDKAEGFDILIGESE